MKTSTQSGNWDDAATWGAAPPAAGDQATIATGHTVTVRDGRSEAVGDSPASAGVVLTIQGTGSLVIGGGTSGTLRVLGSVLFADGATNFLTINAGGTLFVDGSGRTTERYTVSIGYLTQIRFNGTSPLHATVKGTTAGGATPAQFVPNGSILPNTGGVIASHTDFSFLGDATNQAWQTSLNQNFGGTAANDWLFVLDHCTFAHCGEFKGSSGNACAGARFEVTNCTITNATSDASTTWAIHLAPQTPTGGGTYLFTGNSLDGKPRFVNPGGLTLAGNYLGAAYEALSSTERWALFQDNFIRANGPNDNSDLANLNGDASDCYLFADSRVTNNWHATQLARAAWNAATAITGLVWDAPFVDNSSDSGEMFQAPDPTTPQAVTLTGCLILPSATNYAPHGVDAGYLCPPGTLLAVLWPGASTNASFAIEHNTFCGDFGFAFGETGNVPRTGELTSYRSNLVFGGAGSGVLHVNDVTAAFAVNDPVATGHANHNAKFNAGPGHGLNPSGYNYLATVAPGAADIDLGTGPDFQAGGPKFLDPTRNLATWAVAQGYAAAGASLATKVAAALAAIAAAPALTTTSLIPWVRDGFQPQEPSLATAAHDGTTVGALSFHATDGPATTTARAARWFPMSRRSR